jgi:hypothetical protein
MRSQLGVCQLLWPHVKCQAVVKLAAGHGVARGCTAHKSCRAPVLLMCPLRGKERPHAARHTTLPLDTLAAGCRLLPGTGSIPRQLSEQVDPGSSPSTLPKIMCHTNGAVECNGDAGFGILVSTSICAPPMSLCSSYQSPRLPTRHDRSCNHASLLYCHSKTAICKFVSIITCSEPQPLIVCVVVKPRST